MIHHFSSTQRVHHEPPSLLQCRSIKPEAAVGCHSLPQSATPRAIIVGAGSAEAELDDVRTIEGGGKVPWLHPDPLKSAISMVMALFLMTVLLKRVRVCLQANGVVGGSEAKRGEERGVWNF